MSEYKPTIGDIAMDFARCVDEEIPENSVFYKNAIKLWSNLKSSLDPQKQSQIDECLKRFQDKSRNDYYRKEDLYTASGFLKTYYIEQLL